MLGRFGRDAGSLLGVEITPPFIRLVQLQRRRGRCRVQAWALEPLPAAAMHNGWIGDPEQVAAALLKALGRMERPARRVAVALPGALVIEKLISMPASLDEQAIAEQIPSEAAQFIPFSLEEVALDFQVVGLDPGDPGRRQMVVAACHLALLEVLEVALDATGLHACLVEADHHALHRALPVTDAQRRLLLQLESDALVIHEQDAGPMPLRRELSLGGQGRDAQVLVRAVDRYLLSVPGRELPGQLLLLGDAALERHMPGQLQQRLGMPVHQADPFRVMDLAPGLDPQALAAQAPCLAVACGLALREGDRCLV
ncbi:type IV pilus biogenesis protein PilM [Pseudomonas sp. BJa5]|uniref:type IV pilus biogenesis protein PilM n=1 Tax=Pseudomonas sp. BJa5 TaxID=2936270 RepID=UPI002559A399|nr:pilus assembly protein PilM [Pseudomonas sp. BGr12]MDL2421786.1 pilus assembly protein PilM [Pseudomonas sp. BGr12]